MKLNVQQDRIKEARDFPKVVLLDTVSFCNLKCSMCAHKDMKRKPGIMSQALYRKIIDEVARIDKKIRVWLVFFGEVLLLKKTFLLPMIKYAKDRGLSDVVINSNGNLLDADTSKKLIESGLDAVYFGIDAFTASTYAKLRVGGNYEKVVENVRGLIKLKKELKADKPEIFVQFVEMEENAQEVEDFKKFWLNEGAIVKIRPKVSWAGLISASSQTMSLGERWPCHWAMQTMSITNEGKVVCCAVDLDARFVAGDINKDSLRRVWQGKLKELRQLHKEGKFNLLPYPCKDCKDWQCARADYY